MKNFRLLLAFFSALSLFSCIEAPEGEQAVTGDAQATSTAVAGDAYNVDVQASVINWVGAKPTYQHTGTVNIAGGQLFVQDNNITGGEFTIDLKSFQVGDLQGEKKSDLESHLKSDDFFGAEKFPTGKFVITSVAPVSGGDGSATHTITGNLTLRDVTKSITFPANVNIADGKVTATTPSFVINRTEWGVNYDSGILGVAKDKAIADEVGLTINLQAGK